MREMKASSKKADHTVLSGESRRVAVNVLDLEGALIEEVGEMRLEWRNVLINLSCGFVDLIMSTEN